MWNLRVKLIEAKSEIGVCQGLWGGENEEVLVQGYKVSVIPDE